MACRMGRLLAAASCGGVLLPLGAVALPLCDDSIVKETCELIGDVNTHTTSRADLEELTSATPERIAELFQALSLSGDREDCTSLCYAVVGFLSQGDFDDLPEESDTACYEVEGTDGNIRCDLELNHLHPPEGGGDAEDDGHSRGHHGPHRHGHRDGAGLELDYDVRELALKVANFYRIFPALDPSFESPGAAELKADSAGERRLANNEDWRDVLARVATMASVDINHAIRHIRDPRSAKYLKKWFGKHAGEDKYTRKEVIRVMNSVTHVLENAKYVYPGKDCDPSTYAYVEPEGRNAKDKDGRFQVFLCDLFLKDKKAQRETLTHEASHHATAFTDDVCTKSVEHYHKQNRDLKVLKYKSELSNPNVQVNDEVAIHWDGQVYESMVMQVRDNDEVILSMEPNEDCDDDLAYGRRTCISLAKKSPIKALRNADSFCFFIQDVADNLD